ncbi:hypothetical protein AB4212_30770 [Streptomyces sp. 2MCAF27]
MAGPTVGELVHLVAGFVYLDEVHGLADELRKAHRAASTCSRATAELAHTQDEIDHREGWQKPAASLGLAVYLSSTSRGGLLGEYAEPDPVVELRVQPSSEASMRYRTSRRRDG